MSNILIYNMMTRFFVVDFHYENSSKKHRTMIQCAFRNFVRRKYCRRKFVFIRVAFSRLTCLTIDDVHNYYAIILTQKTTFYSNTHLNVYIDHFKRRNYINVQKSKTTNYKIKLFMTIITRTTNETMHDTLF